MLTILLSVIFARPADADDALAVRGAYLAAAAGCDQCHTDSKNGGTPYAGGRVIATAFGPITTPNITPDKATGIGGWSTADFVRAMRWGIAPDGTHYVTAFPFRYFAGLTDTDLADLKAYLDSLPPISQPDIAAPASLALFARARAAIATAMGSATGVAPKSPVGDTPAARGAYLVETVGHCGDCHTPVGWDGAPDLDRYLAGSRGGIWGGGPNLTPDAKTGIGDWAAEDIAKALKSGETPDFDILGGAMSEIVRDTARLTDEDRAAIAAYLKTLSPKVFSKNN